MQTTAVQVGEERVVAAGAAPIESPMSAISWAAIIAGAFAMSAISLILVALGAGLGLYIAVVQCEPIRYHVRRCGGDLADHHPMAVGGLWRLSHRPPAHQMGVGAE